MQKLTDHQEETLGMPTAVDIPWFLPCTDLPRTVTTSRQARLQHLAKHGDSKSQIGLKSWHHNNHMDQLYFLLLESVNVEV